MKVRVNMFSLTNGYFEPMSVILNLLSMSKVKFVILSKAHTFSYSKI